MDPADKTRVPAPPGGEHHGVPNWEAADDGAAPTSQPCPLCGEMLHVTPGEVLVLRGLDHAEAESLFDQLEVVRPNITVLATFEGQTVEKLDEEAMRAIGWVRAPQGEPEVHPARPEKL